LALAFDHNARMTPADLVFGERAARTFLVDLKACQEAGEVVLRGKQWAHIDPVLAAIRLPAPKSHAGVSQGSMAASDA
jgi:hypothetical protein